MKVPANTVAIALALMTVFGLSMASPALADGHGEERRDCEERDVLLPENPVDHATGNEHQGDDCTRLEGGEMSCDPPEGEAADSKVVVGGADEGTFQVRALGVANKAAANGCFFEVVLDASQIRFNEGYTQGLLAPYGSASDAGDHPCFAQPGDACIASASFHWEREAHGVTFDVPYELRVNGVVVDQGEVHYYDPPLFEALTGGPVVLS